MFLMMNINLKINVIIVNQAILRPKMSLPFSAEKRNMEAQAVINVDITSMKMEKKQMKLNV